MFVTALALIAPAHAISGVRVMLTDSHDFAGVVDPTREEVVVVVDETWIWESSDVRGTDRSGDVVSIWIDPTDLPQEVRDVVDPDFLRGSLVGIIEPSFLVSAGEDFVVAPDFLVGIIEPSFLSPSALDQLDAETEGADTLGIMPYAPARSTAIEIDTGREDRVGIINPDSL